MLKKIMVLSLAFLLAFSIIGYAKEEIIRVGFYGPITGPTALLGKAQVNGLKLAVEQINASGGIDGKKMVLIMYDDKSSPELAVKDVTRLIDRDKVHVIVASLHSGNILATAPIVEKAKIPELGPGTSPKWLQQGYKYLFRVLPNSTWGNKGLVKAMRTLGLTKVGILHRADEYGKTGSSDLIERVKEAGLEVVGNESYPPGDNDFTGQLAKLLNTDVDAMVMYGITDEAGVQMKQLRQMGYKGYVFGPEGFSSPDVRLVGGKAVDGAIFASAYVIPDSIKDAVNPLEEKFLKSYIAKYGEMPESDNAYRTYDAINIFALAIKRAGSLDGTKIRNEIENITNYEGLAGTFNYKGNHGEGINDIRVWIVMNSKIMPLDNYLKQQNK